MAGRDLRWYGRNFLMTIGRLERRDKDGRRLMSVDKDFAGRTMKEAREYLEGIYEYRIAVATWAKTGQVIKPLKDTPTYKISGMSVAEVRAALRRRSSEDVVFWMDNFVFTFSPHLTKFGIPMKLPFILFEKQVEYMRWREKRYRRNECGVVFKCRDMGVSWMNAAHQVHKFMFEPGFQGRFGSRKESLVDDKKNPDTLFWKVRFILYNLPAWMLPEGLRRPGNKNDSSLTIYNPDNGAVLAGEGGEKMGTGGRASMYDVDEWAKVEHDFMVDASISMNCPVRFYTSTPCGPANDFAAKVQANKLPIFSFEWWDDPRKSRDWYDNFKEANSAAVVAQEIDKDFKAYSTGTAIPANWVAASVSLWQKLENGELALPPSGRAGGMDIAAGGRNKTVLIWRDGIKIMGAYEWDISLPSEICQKAGTVCEAAGVEVLGYDPIAIGHGIREHFELNKYVFNARPVDYRGRPSQAPLDGDTKPARETCLNLRAELMERVRRRFELTYEYIAMDKKHPLEKLVAVPGQNKLTHQVSIPERIIRNGVIQLESKESLVKRGVQSLDYFDALLISFANEAEKLVIHNAGRALLQKEESLPPFDVDVGDGQKRYVSIYHSKNYCAAAIGALWRPQMQMLTVHSEITMQNSNVPRMCAEIKKRFGGKIEEYIGNAEMFSPGADDIGMQYTMMDVPVIENFMFDKMGAMSQMTAMIDRGSIKLGPDCKILRRQIEGFQTESGVPDESGMELVMALLNMIGRLADDMPEIKAPPPLRHYWKTGTLT